MLHLSVVLAAWCLFAGEAAAQYVGGGQPSPETDGASVGVGTGASIDVEIVTPKQLGPNWGFSAKFLCGEIPALDEYLAEGSPLAPGSYRTAINIHNPNPLAVTFEMKAVIANAQRQPRGAISLYVPDLLEADQALEVDCVDIQSLFEDMGPVYIEDELVAVIDSGFFKGFVVITVPRLQQGHRIATPDVVGVYTLKNVDVITVAPQPPNECLAQNELCDPNTIGGILECCAGLTCQQDLDQGPSFYCQPQQPDPGCF